MSAFGNYSQLQCQHCTCILSDLDKSDKTFVMLPHRTENKYDLAVAYRICPRTSRSLPPVCAESKYTLSALCLRSFKSSLGTLRVKVWAILDDCPIAYEELFKSLWSSGDLVLLRYPRIGNAATFGKQIEVLTRQNDANIVYLAEDDYVYLPGKFHRLVDLMRANSDVDFCSPYDHPDYYNHSFHLHRSRVKVEAGQVWKTQNCTTCTMLMRKSTLKETRSTLLSYTRFKRWNVDVCIWLSLTKELVLNPFRLLTLPFMFPYVGASLVFAWLLNWKQILFGRRYSLWVPVPSLATHMVNGLLAPYVDWRQEFLQAETVSSSPLAA
jgi:hypothetical protein